MTELKFVTDEQGHVEVKVVENVGLKADGSTMDISNSLMENALKMGIFQQRAYARGYDNAYYKCNDCTFLRIKDNKVVLIDSYVDAVEGVWIAEIFKKKSVNISRSTGHEYSRGVPRMTLPQVVHLNKKRKDIVTSKNYPVELATIIWALNSGNIKTLENEPGWSFDIQHMTIHHDGFDWDNRLCQTMYLTEQEHIELHSEVGEWSHQCYCKITTIEELVAFLKFIGCYEVKK